MCGICGVVFARPERRVPAEMITRMRESIHHRGPDACGQHLSGRVGLGHERLSIVDLARGQQPMCNEDGTVWITYNGEVYNHALHRASLVARGHVYRTNCDTEAVIHLAEEFGAVKGASALRGMFAYALWDEKDQTLSLVRDRSGIKPLFYALTGDGDLVFSSEIKGVFASGLIKPTLNADTVAEYFALGSVTGGRTLYRDIRSLEPGCVLQWKDGRARIERYWTVPDAAAADGVGGGRAVEQASREFWTRFREAVDITLMADVPLGVFLSGGLDSSLIVAAMRELGIEQLRTFSVGYTEQDASELPHARVVAKAFATDHHEVTCSPAEFFELLPRLTGHRDHPLTFSASIPLYVVSRLAVQSVKVVLTGEGSDELFAGYGRYPRAMWNRRLARTLDASLAPRLRTALARGVAGLGDGYLSSRLKRSSFAHGPAFEDWYLESFTEFGQAQREGLLGNGGGMPYALLGGLIDRDLLQRNPLEAMLRFDQATYLDELLAKQDQMSMATSIESRVPFLDHHLVEWAAGLAPRVKLRGFVGKALVRRAAERVLPRDITQARKRGFTVPLGQWLRTAGRDMLHAYLPASDDGLLHAGTARQWLDEHMQGIDHSGRLWRLLAFQVWRVHVLAGTRVDQALATR